VIAPDLPSQPTGPRHWVRWAVAAGAVLAASVLALVHFREKPRAVPVVRFQIASPGETPFPLLSPDGSRLVFFTPGPNGIFVLWVRPLDSLEAHPLQGTEGAVGTPFWSSDSRYIAFFTQDSKLKKIAAVGGSAETLCDARVFVGGFWTPDDKGTSSIPAGTPAPPASPLLLPRFTSGI
jgi:hypothetical protein